MANQGNLGGNHPCTAGSKVCIQVTGHGHQGKPQKLFFYEQDIQQPKIVDSNEVKPQNPRPFVRTLDPNDCPSTLFHWEQCDIAGLKLGLQIDKTDGGKLYLPIADKIASNANYDEKNQHKYNQLIAFIPFSIYDLPRITSYFTENFNQPDNPENLMPSGSPTNYSNTVYATARPGFLYIFYQNKLWREIYITQDATGKNIYQDIDVEGERENGKFKTDVGCGYKKNQPQQFVMDNTPIRPAVGVELEEIWIPHKISGKKVTVQMLFSEDQLSGERLNLIEQTLTPTTSERLSDKARHAANIASILVSVQTHEEWFRYAKGTIKASSLNYSTPAFRMDYLPPTRGRNEKIEWRLFNPVTYLTDTQGKSLKQKYNVTKQIDSQCLAKDPPDRDIANSDFNGLKGTFKDFEIDAWHQILESQYSEKTSDNEIWPATSADTATDVIAEYQQRYILGIAVPDPLHELHRMQTLLDIAQSSKLFSYLAIRASNDSNNAMGHFAYNMSFLFPQVKDTIENELSKAIKHNYNRAISGCERLYLQNLIAHCQDKMAKLLQQPTTEQAIINLLSNHIPHYYAANLNFMANCFSAISKAPIAYDSLAATITADITEGQVLINELATDKDSQLHRALWPQTCFDDLTKILPEPQPIAGDNQGDGLWYAPALIAVRDWNITNPAQELNNLKLQTFAVQAESQLENNLLLIKDTLKLGWAGIYNSTSLWLDAIDGANKALDEVVVKASGYNITNSNLQTATAEANKSQTDVDKERGILNQDTTKQEEAIKRDNANTRNLSQAEKNLRELETRAKATLAKRAGLFRGKEFLGLIFQSRLSLPQLKSLGYILPRETAIRYIAFGDYSQGTLDELEKILRAFPGGRARKPGTLAEKLLTILEKMGDAAREIRNGLNFIKDVFVLGIPNALENRRLIAAYAESIDQAFDAMLAKMESAAKRAAAVEKVMAQRSILARALWDHRKNLHALTAARNFADEAETLLRAAHHQYLSLEQQQSQFALRNESFLRGKTIPGIVFFIEICNITALTLTASSTYEDRGFGRVAVGGFSGFVDGGFALALFVERFNGHRAQVLNRALSKEVSAGILRFLGVSKIPIRGLVGAGAMLLTAGICFWDAAYYYNDNNPAWIGYAMSGVGASVLVYQSLAAAALTGPIGWLVLGIGLGLMIAGMFLANKWNNSNKIKEWFKQGLFAGEITNIKYLHLKDPQQAIYRLLSELIQITVKVEPINKQQTSSTIDNLSSRNITDTTLQHQQRLAQIANLRQLQEKDYKVSVRCYFAGLLQSCVFIPYLAKYQSVAEYTESGSTSVTITRMGEITVNELNNKVTYNATGMDFYLAIPNSMYDNNGNDVTNTSYQWIMQLQIHAYPATPTLDHKFWVFPAPRLNDSSEYTPETATKYSRPVFPEEVTNWYSDDVDIDYQPFWQSKVLLTSKL